MYAQSQSAMQMPGYTGYKPSSMREEEEARILAGSMREETEGRKVPGYQGYVSGIKSENVFGETYGSTTQKSKEGAYPKGFDVSDGQRYGTVTKNTYTEQMSQKVFGRPNPGRGGAASPGRELAYKEAASQASWARKLDPNPPQKIPLLTD